LTGHPGDKSEGRERRDDDHAGGPHDSSNRHERKADDQPQGGRREDAGGIPKTREAEEKPRPGRKEDEIPKTREAETKDGPTDALGLPKTREAEPEDPSNRIERDGRTPYDDMRKPGNEGGSSDSEYRPPSIGRGPQMPIPKSKQAEGMEKIMAGKMPNFDERTGKLDPRL
jgi:hypothetical protein